MAANFSTENIMVFLHMHSMIIIKNLSIMFSTTLNRTQTEKFLVQGSVTQ